MELPNWVVDEVLTQAKPTAFRLAVMFYRHGTPRVNGQGHRILYYRGSYARLRRITGASKPALIEVVRRAGAKAIVRELEQQTSGRSLASNVRGNHD